MMQALLRSYMLQCNFISIFRKKPSQLYLLRSAVRAFTVMANNSEDGQSPSENTTNDTAVNIAEAEDKQEPDDIKQESEGKRKPKNKKRRVQGNSYVKIPKPNYFIGIKVDDKEIVENAEKVQQHMVNKHKALQDALIELPTLHLTLAVMALNDKDEDVMKKSLEAMEHCLKLCGPSLIAAPLTLTFKGLGHFPSGVVFVKVQEGDELNRLIEIARQVRESFGHYGIPLHDESFTPHLTLLKTSKLHEKWKEIKVVKKLIKEDLYNDYSDLLFGTEDVICLQLLSMNKEKDENGYYNCMKSISFRPECPEG